ncbi:MAG: hypothetical protein RLZZ461_1018 [Planctomycetota bacterium]
MTADEHPTTAEDADGVRTVDHRDPELLRHAIADAFDYRGDVTIVLHDGSVVDGFIFDHRNEITFESSSFRILTPQGRRLTVEFPRLREIRFTGRDAAAGRTWANWVRRYAEKTLAGETASIDSEPLD